MRTTMRALIAVVVMSGALAVPRASEADAPAAPAVRVTSRAQLNRLPPATVVELGDKSRTTAGALVAKLAMADAIRNAKVASSSAIEKRAAAEATKTSGIVLLPAWAVHCNKDEACLQNEGNVAQPDNITTWIDVGFLGEEIWPGAFSPLAFTTHITANLAPGWVLDHITVKNEGNTGGPPTGFVKGAKSLSLTETVNGPKGGTVLIEIWVYVKGSKGETVYPSATPAAPAAVPTTQPPAAK